MKTFIAFSLLILGISALPQINIIEGVIQNDERLITGQIVKAIEDLSQSIRDAGLDPGYIEKESLEYALPVPILFNIQVYVEELLFKGLSHIVVHKVDYSIITNRLTFDIRLPKIDLTIRKAVKHITIFGSWFESHASGKLAIFDVRVTGTIRIGIGIISGISIRNIDIDFSLGGIISELKIVFFGKDLSHCTNRFLGKVVPGKLNEFSNDINDLIEIVLKQVIEANLY